MGKILTADDAARLADAAANEGSIPYPKSPQIQKCLRKVAQAAAQGFTSTDVFLWLCMPATADNVTQALRTLGYAVDADLSLVVVCWVDVSWKKKAGD